MNFSKRNRSVVDFLFIMALFGAFAITGLFVVLFGARVYEKTVSNMDANYSTRTALSYVTEKIRSHDFNNGAEIVDSLDGSKEGNSVLILKETVNGRNFITYMYVSDGYLKEFTADENYDFAYDNGTKILEVEKFKVKKAGDALYDFHITDKYGDNTQFYVSLYSRSDGEVIDE